MKRLPCQLALVASLSLGTAWAQSEGAPDTPAEPAPAEQGGGPRLDQPSTTAPGQQASSAEDPIPAAQPPDSYDARPTPPGPPPPEPARLQQPTRRQLPPSTIGTDKGPAATSSNPSQTGPSHLGVELAAAVTTRLQRPPSFEHGQVVDIAYSGGLWYESQDQFGIGAGYEYSGLGTGRTDQSVDRVEVSYDAHFFWASGRLYPYQTDHHGVFLSARLGLVLMHQSAHGTRTAQFDEPAGVPFICSTTSTPNLGLGTSLGFVSIVSQHVKFVGQLAASMLRSGSGVVNGCVPGPGSLVTLNASVGFAYTLGV